MSDPQAGIWRRFRHRPAICACKSEADPRAAFAASAPASNCPPHWRRGGGGLAPASWRYLARFESPAAPERDLIIGRRKSDNTRLTMRRRRPLQKRTPGKNSNPKAFVPRRSVPGLTRGGRVDLTALGL
jgi:hypothetical protein